MTITDDFSATTLDATKWTDHYVGTVALQTGFPTAGCFIHGVDDHLDHVYVESKGKIILPAAQYFLIRLFYDNLYIDEEQNLRFYLGYRSDQQDILGNPLYGADVMMMVDTGSVYTFQQRVISGGVETIQNIIADPLSGANGGFQIIRNGTVYSLYRYDGLGWSLLTDINLGFSGSGYIQFGVYAEDATLSMFPWVLQT